MAPPPPPRLRSATFVCAGSVGGGRGPGAVGTGTDLRAATSTTTARASLLAPALCGKAGASRGRDAPSRRVSESSLVPTRAARQLRPERRERPVRRSRARQRVATVLSNAQHQPADERSRAVGRDRRDTRDFASGGDTCNEINRDGGGANAKDQSDENDHDGTSVANDEDNGDGEHGASRSAAATAAPQRGSLPFAANLDRFLNHPLFELGLTASVLAVAASFAIETLPQVSTEVRRSLRRIEDTISALFAVEYVLRFYARNLDPRYLLRKSMIIDFVSIFPLLVAQRMSDDALDLGFVRLLRILRILRLERLVEEDTFRRVFGGRRGVGQRSGRVEARHGGSGTDDGEACAARSAPGADADTTTTSTAVSVSSQSSPSSYAEYKLRIAQIAFTLVSILWITSGLVYDAEHVANADQFGTFFDALYFSIVTLTTVGFGDKVPVTSAGRAVIAAAILVGVAIVPFQIGQLGRALLFTAGDDGTGTRAGVGTSADGSDMMTPDGSRAFSAHRDNDSDDVAACACIRCGAREHAGDARYCRICAERLPPR